ncbi:class I SAM-dependent methyltransferase [Pedobacter sp.]|jgi:SAM-dependent methyltransferase|uniref:class I SAM-dependent methyltransferase n=1 Tax=Pedobacter sp. TaxID=1411316 RepID=UPI002BFFAB88|nr:class I SAM-dependent methyltransferase [Pedobacter sp.]HWW42877.1 class I SAM-dependent methyltransferase [Pedobacter sp.]
MDIFGEALQDQFIKGTTETLWLHNSYDAPEEMPVDIFFRGPEEMPEIELKALTLCRGTVLDAGAGAGSHALWLQQQKIEVTALDISEKATTIMKQRGVKQVLQQDLFSLKGQQFDTLLLLMNGIGLTGSIAGLQDFLQWAKSLLKKDGQLLFDSSDIAYLYQDIDFPQNKYYGEVAYQYEYKQQKGNWFNWLYVDQAMLLKLAKEAGWQCEIILEDEYDQYLAQLRLSTR